MSQRSELMSNKSSSKIPKTQKQKQMWIKARQIVTKQSGATSEKKMPWGLVTTIFKNAKAANKVPKKSDVTKAKKSPAVSKYKTGAK